MHRIKDFNVRYITDKNGKKTEVILPLEDFERLLEDLQDLATAAERREEESIPHEELIKQLKEDGLL